MLILANIHGWRKFIEIDMNRFRHEIKIAIPAPLSFYFSESKEISKNATFKEITLYYYGEETMSGVKIFRLP